MKISCISCRREINLDHDVFKDYEGSVKCFCCSSMMEIKTTGGVLEAAYFMRILPEATRDDTVERAI